MQEAGEDPSQEMTFRISVWPGENLFQQRGIASLPEYEYWGI